MKTIRTGDALLKVWAARGGHGATTVAGALGALLGVSVRSHDEEAYEWMWGKPGAASLLGDISVHDAGIIADPLPAEHTNVAVLRGPCSLAIRKLAYLNLSDSLDHLVLLREPWRPLRPQDAEDALGIGIAAEVQFSPRVGRLADAGLLSARLVDLPEFAGLKTWVGDRLAVAQPNRQNADGAQRRSDDVRRPPS